MSTSKKKSTMLGMVTLGMLAASLMIGSDVYASAIQTHPPETIFAASCATCHGASGQGGVTWVKDGPGDNRRAPNLSGLDRRYVVSKVRSGAKNGAMPAFGREEITDAELNALANWIQAGGYDTYVADGLEPPTAPAPADTVNLYILDADPWFSDDANWSSDGDYDDNTAAGTTSYSNTSSDVRRVALGAPSSVVKVINTGRTWHTFTNSGKSKDSGFIGYAGNYNIDAGDLGDMGYYYADQTTGLASGCVRYLCKMHPYMQVEVCTAGASGAQVVDNAPIGGPAGPEDPLGLTRAHKHPLTTVPSVLGVGEVWVTVQSQDNPGEDTVSLDLNNGSKSVVGMDGAYQVIDATYTAVLPSGLKNVGNNPHNAWPIDEDGDGLAEEVLTTNWHDNTVTLMDANPFNRVVLNEKKIGATIAHAMAQPSLTSERFFVTQMGGRGIHEVDLADLRAGLDASLGAPIAGASGPHGLWFCGDGSHILTADTFGNSATWYNIDDRSSTTAGSNGAAPLAPAIAEGINSIADGDACDRGFTNNALTADLSVYDMDGDSITRNTTWTDAPGSFLYKKSAAYTTGAGNIALRMRPTDIGWTDQVVDIGLALGFPGIEGAPGIVTPRWVHLPIQTPVSPPDATTHGRFVVTANKASFNVSVTELDSTVGPTLGDPIATYTFPAGLGAHGVTYGPKAVCDTDDDGTEGNEGGADVAPANGYDDASEFVNGARCYFAYVTNTFEDYVSVYDLEKIDDNVSMGTPGSALIAERVYVEGGAVAAVAALDGAVAGLCDAFLADPTCEAAAPAGSTGCIDELAVGIDINGDGATSGDGVFGDGVDVGTATDDVPILYCGVGPTGGFYVSNLPIGVLCPDCRSGVHVADIPLTLTTGAPLGGTYTGLGTLTASGAASKYTYLHEEVWVDTETVACVLATLDTLTAFAGGGLAGANDCTSGTGDLAGTLNLEVSLDLDLGINTGGQGIVGVPAATPWP